MILFGFPHCGDVAKSYLAWSHGLPAHIKFQCVELIHAGLSMREVYSARWEQALEEACAFIKQHLEPGEEYVLIGHCWGSLLAFEVSHRLKEEGLAEPRHLFLSGCSAPHLLRPRAEAGGPLGRAAELGCQPAEEYRTPLNRGPLRARFSIFTGNKDEHALADQLAEWSRYTSKICDVHVCEGDHAFWRADSVKWLQLTQTIVEREYLI
ncbi:thioesterase II family protein [Paenibacillus alba]|uniref:Thioesterase domain-containing protein n=1 Tax=Paenibacillus alba TaxID=1197127 RepID=A0ABU6G8N2_9BACL|nr:thioesterase domain-containing protein [Paenibacillus alba]MEC0230310.1 thioesterase domain-containing protein [Paenibacillus alba]